MRIFLDANVLFSAAYRTDSPLRALFHLAAAVQAQADILVTGDRTDFGALYGRKLRGLEILPPRTALERILAA